MTDGNRWLERIKQIRTEHGCGIAEAERIALTDRSWRRWLDRQINAEPQCRAMALRHIRDRGENALIERDGDRLKIRF